MTSPWIRPTTNTALHVPRKPFQFMNRPPVAMEPLATLYVLVADQSTPIYSISSLWYYFGQQMTMENQDGCLQSAWFSLWIIEMNICLKLPKVFLYNIIPNYWIPPISYLLSVGGVVVCTRPQFQLLTYRKGHYFLCLCNYKAGLLMYVHREVIASLQQRFGGKCFIRMKSLTEYFIGAWIFASYNVLIKQTCMFAYSECRSI